ncbi:uncharacterized protein BDZ83DRAFT_647880 [Colletotrichum acutatum]|uniref:Uncharacterized protein n=1 Tax=Glomerella acutata TaxID=27357 RepID=A0AAD9D082_GLOAC|nr:uncharacterized protein BDZ83DRAFT_647880 [Colletotrichum acutatum]KAK1729220.1 hypothetical protein BDZ83DRAFT_647880 [Colletotrichum acutatum]
MQRGAHPGNTSLMSGWERPSVRMESAFHPPPRTILYDELQTVVCVPEEWLTGASVVNVWLVMTSTAYYGYLRYVGQLARPRSEYFDSTSDVPRGRESGAPVLPPKSPCGSAEVLTMST